MAEPWKKYQQQTDAKPWEKYGGARPGPTVEAAQQQLADQAAYLRSENIPDAFKQPPMLDPNATGDTMRENPSDPMTRFRGALGNYVDTALLGGADEALAGLYAAGAMVPGGRSPGQAFQDELARLEQQRRDYNALNTPEGAGATGAGIVLNPLNLIGGEFISAGTNAATRAGRSALLGAGIGGTGGALGTEGGLPERATGAAIGAGAGALLGGTAQPGLELLGFGARKGLETGAGVVNTIRNQMEARVNPKAQAEKLIKRAFIDDAKTLGYGPAPIDAPLPGQGLINLGGENLTSLGRQGTVAPGPTKTRAMEFFGEQSAAAPDRAADALKPLADKGYYGTVQELDLTRRATAKPLYDLAYSKPAVEVWTPRISELMKRPSMKAAFAKAQRIAAEEGRNPKELGLDFNEAGDPMFLVGADKNGQIPSTQTLDYIKRGLDDVVEAYRDKTSGKLVLDTEGRAINNTRAELVGILREGNKDYSAALDAWGGPSHALDTLNFGREIYAQRGNPAESLMRFQKLSPADQELARIGFVRNAVADLGNTGDAGSVYLKLFGNQNKRAALQVLFKDADSFNKFATQMQAEKEMLAANRKVMGGSPTARILAENAHYDQASNALNFLDALRSGNIFRIAGQALDKARNLQRGVTPEVADELGRRLFEADPIAIQRILSAVSSQTPAPITAVGKGLLRNTPIGPLLGQGAGLLGASMAPQPMLVPPQAR